MYHHRFSKFFFVFPASLKQTAADGGAGSAAALREVLLPRGDAPLPLTPEET